MYILFFANGIEHYRKASQEDTVLHPENLISLNQMKKDELGTTAFFEGFTDIYNRYTKALSLQHKAMEAISFNTQAKITAWNDLKNKFIKICLALLFKILIHPIC